MLTWFVIGPVSSTLRTWNGGLAENAIASPRTVTHTSLPSGVKNASRGERPTYVTCFTALVAVSMKLTELEPIETTTSDLLLLVDDDLLGKPLQALVPSVAQLGDRHVDGTLVVRDHHACEVAVRTAREGHVHGRMHAGSRALDHRLEPGAPGRGLAVRGSAREGESENRGEREGRRLPENRLESGGMCSSKPITRRQLPRT